MRYFASLIIALALCSGAACAAPASGSVTLANVLAANDWLNGRPTAADIRGKVVLLDFYTFGCFNCKNTEPNLRALYKNTSRKDLVIISVHCPETPYEKNRAHLIASLGEQGIAWPVAVDNEFQVWNAYGVNAWPTQMIFDRHGALSNTIVGDSQDAAVNSTIDRLVRER
jgi:thiol-disulfide isomerase/thioredoxin